jgi:hypothetical protein
MLRRRRPCRRSSRPCGRCMGRATAAARCAGQPLSITNRPQLFTTLPSLFSPSKTGEHLADGQTLPACSKLTITSLPKFEFASARVSPFSQPSARSPALASDGPNPSHRRRQRHWCRAPSHTQLRQTCADTRALCLQFVKCGFAGSNFPEHGLSSPSLAIPSASRREPKQPGREPFLLRSDWQLNLSSLHPSHL